LRTEKKQTVRKPCFFVRFSLRSVTAQACGSMVFYFYWGFFASPKPWHHPFNLRYAQSHRTT
jgi:hypothetical protein